MYSSTGMGSCVCCSFYTKRMICVLRQVTSANQYNYLWACSLVNVWLIARAVPSSALVWLTENFFFLFCNPTGFVRLVPCCSAAVHARSTLAPSVGWYVLYFTGVYIGLAWSFNNSQPEWQNSTHVDIDFRIMCSIAAFCATLGDGRPRLYSES